jgi:transcriptional regulator with XRE-family HTH domain
MFIKTEIEAKKLGSNIKVARKRRKMSLIELSAKSSVSKSMLSRIEAGDHRVGFGKVFNVLEALGLLRGLADFISPDTDSKQAIKEIKALRKGRDSSARPKSKVGNLVRFD